jgi:carboxypeptidase PM20D1
VVEKGYATVRLSVSGAGGHASMPPRQTPLGVLAAAMARLEDQPLEAHYHGPAGDFLEALAAYLPLPERVAVANGWLFAPLLSRRLSRSPETDALLRTTTAVTTATGGVAENVLPELAQATVNFRIHPRERVEDVLEHARRVIDDERVALELLAGSFEPSAASPIEGEAWWLVQRCIEECFDGVAVAPALVVGATDSRHYARLGAPIYRFAPLRLEREDLARLHGVDERISIEDYVAMIRFYLQLLRSC